MLARQRASKAEGFWWRAADIKRHAQSNIVTAGSTRIDALRYMHISKMKKRLYVFVQAILSPITILCILSSTRFHPAYRLSAFRKLRLGLTFFLNRTRVQTATSPKVHLAIAMKLFEIPPDVSGVVMECGTWKGGTAANLSLICKVIGRRLLVCDSFQGLPQAPPNDREGHGYGEGDYAGSLQEVKENIRRYGCIDCCTFIQGWFEETLPYLDQAVVAAYVDVDLESSLATCVKHIWPRLTDEGLIFIDECVGVDYCALFFSERWWKENFSRTPPGMIGVGTGLPLGDFYVGPFSELSKHPLHHVNTGAYTSKSMSGYWAYYPSEQGN